MSDDLIPVPAAAVEQLRLAMDRREGGMHGAVPVLSAARALVDAVPRETDDPLDPMCKCGDERSVHSDSGANCNTIVIDRPCECRGFRPVTPAPPEPVCQLPHWHILDDRCEPSPPPVSAEEAAHDPIFDALYDLIVDHPMWIDDDGKPLEYNPNREGLIGHFLDAAVAAVRVIIAESDVAPRRLDR